MSSAGAQYSHLHQLLIQLKDVQDQLAKGPRQIKLKQARVTEAEQLLAAKEVELKESRAASDRKNLDLKSKESHLTDLQGKLNQAASNREFDIIRGQMEADRAAKAVLEDEILEWLDRIDLRQQEIVACKKAVQEAGEEVRRFANEFEQKSIELRQEEIRLNAEIAEAEKVIPTEIKPQYRRLVEAYGAESLASSQNGVCNQCHVNLTSQNKVHLNSGKLMFCSVCGRLLYPAE
ncbi:zinc ribbon domain-containing protein [Planctomicrobium sp. SH661]|uniref:zinc ribbon domain-containing protein n=1 Tax=Planctomicrobium sp. SH661 TaxID=3448124 RepID=UPI003F5C7B57